MRLNKSKELVKQLEIVYVCTVCGRKFRLALPRKTCPSCGGTLIQKVVKKGGLPRQYAVFCRNCGLIGYLGSLVPYRYECPKCGYKGKLGVVRRWESRNPIHLPQLFVCKVNSIGYSRVIEYFMEKGESEY